MFAAILKLKGGERALLFKQPWEGDGERYQVVLIDAIIGGIICMDIFEVILLPQLSCG